MHDLIIKGGTLVDGTGASPRTADVAVDSVRITDVGHVEGGAARRPLASSTSWPSNSRFSRHFTQYPS